MGNILFKYEVHKIAAKQRGGSTLGGRKVWFGLGCAPLEL